MKLFELDDTYNVIFNPEIFLLKDFRDLRDSRKKKVDLIYQELAYIYFYCDLKSDFQFEADFDKRKKDVIRFVGLPEDWEPDELILTCIDVYLYLSQTVSSKLLETAYMGVDKFTSQLKSINLNERDNNGRPIWNQKQIMDIMSNIPNLLKTVREAELEFLKNEDKDTRLRGDKIKTLYEDGFKKLKMTTE